MAADRVRDHKGLSAAGRGATVILDSNFLFVPLRFGVDIFDELRRLLGGPHRCVVPRPVVDELKLLRPEAKPSLKKEIDFALKLTERCEVLEEELGAGETVDDFLLRSAADKGWLVATNDSDLRQRLRRVGVPVIYLRQRAYLEIDGLV